MKRSFPQSVRCFFRRFFRDTAQGNHCLSVGALALGLGFGSLIPPAAVPLNPDPQQPAPAELAVPAPPPPQPAPSPLNLLDTHDIPAGPFGALIYEAASRYSLNPHLVAAIVRVESSFNPRALSRKGACGLMQLLPETARRFGLTRKKDLYDPRKNLEAGVRYLKWLANRFGGDTQKILAAYNAGEGAVQRFGGIPPYQETQSYVQKIFGLLGFSSTPAPAAPAPQTAELASAQDATAAR